MSSPSNPNQILIVGGGISGLALGQSLNRLGIPFTIFERDASPSFRAQGYRLSIRTSGEEALQYLLVEEKWAMVRAMGTGAEDRGVKGMPFAGDAVSGDRLVDGGPFKIFMSKANQGKGSVSAEQGQQASQTQQTPQTQQAQLQPGAPTEPKRSPKPARRPPAFATDRTVLRHLLTLDIESHIQYDRTFISFTTSSSPASSSAPPTPLVTASFIDGTFATGSLLIGCDGVRSLTYSSLLSFLSLPAPTVLDIDLRVIYGKTLLIPSMEAAVPEAWRKSSAFFVDPRDKMCNLFVDTVIFNNRAEEMTGGKVETPGDYLYWAFSAPTSAFSTIDTASSSKVTDGSRGLRGPGAAAVLASFTSHWHPSLRALFTSQDLTQTSTLPVLSSPPTIPLRPSHACITAMGDAVHPMSPTGGAGANTALCDAAALSRGLEKAWNGNGWRDGAVEKAIKNYEEQMREYAKDALKSSFNNLTFLGADPNPEKYKPLVS